MNLGKDKTRKKRKKEGQGKEKTKIKKLGNKQDKVRKEQKVYNDQRATATSLSVGIESCSLKYFTDTKFVYRKIVELLVFAWTNIVTHY